MTPPPVDAIPRDLGLSGRLAQDSTSRLLNRDGSFSVERLGMPVWDFVHPYHRLLSMSWPVFFVLVGVVYALVNLLFAEAYVLCGPGALAGAEADTAGGRLMHAFFFSIQTLATIGYGRITPTTPAANFLVAIEALVGLMGFALITGILFARFSRPMARIAFSENAIIAPYRGGRGLMFRIANGRTNELTNISAVVTLARMEIHNGLRQRRFHQLPLERNSVTFMPMYWVVVHPVDEQSPLHGVRMEDLAGADVELLVLLTATDETFSQTVQTRSSYKHDEFVWGARFRDIHAVNPRGGVTIDLRRLGEHDLAELP